MAPPAIPTSCSAITGSVRTGHRLVALPGTGHDACCEKCCGLPSECVAFNLYTNMTCELLSTEGGEHKVSATAALPLPVAAFFTVRFSLPVLR